MDDISRFATLQREHDDTPDQGTPGVITCDTGIQFYSLELPYRDLDHNGVSDPMLSCIDAGIYVCWLEESEHFHEKDGSKAWLYHIQDVPGRTAVKIHWGNWAGDTKKGLKSDVLGCQLQGLGRAVMDGQKALVHTRDAVSQFKEEMNNQPFKLIVKDAQ